MGGHIDNMICEYHIYTIDNINTTEEMNAYRLIDAWEDYEQFNYVKVFLKFWIWDWRKMIPDELVEKIEPFE